MCVISKAHDGASFQWTNLKGAGRPDAPKGCKDVRKMRGTDDLIIGGAEREGRTFDPHGRTLCVIGTGGLRANTTTDFVFFFVTLKWQSTASRAESFFCFFLTHVFATSSLSVCASAEEVILADDENENDYDGNGSASPPAYTQYMKNMQTSASSHFKFCHCFSQFLQGPAGEPPRTIRAKLSY